MKYNTYMDLFTVSPEVKSSVFNKVKQYERQLSAKPAEAKPKIATPAPKKINTFNLHPKRWIAIATSIVLVAVLTPIIYFSVPRGNFEDNSLSLDYMKNLMVNVEGITAYSIRKETESTNSKASVKTVKTASVSLLSAKLLADDTDKDNDNNRNDDKDNDNNKDKTKHNYYLYSTSEDYEYGNVEYDSKGIQRVVFIKNTEVIEDVYDKDGNLIDSNRTITQDELDAQINKMYTTKQYTFIQFVPLVESSGEYPYKDSNGKTQYEYVDLRPDSMVYDEYGVSEFDTTGYFSSNLTASFIIDNSTGYIYKIENLYIKEFVNGLVKDDNGNYYSITTDLANNLLLTDLMPNKDVVIQDALIDNYGWVHVANDSVGSIDIDKKIIYTSGYFADSDRNVYLLDYNLYGLPYITHEIIDGEAVDYQNDKIIKFPTTQPTYGHQLVGVIYDLYIIQPEDYVIIVDPAGDHDLFWKFVAYNREVTCGLYFDCFASIMGSVLNYHWLDNNYDTLLTMSGGIVYYTQFKLSDYRDKLTPITFEADFIQLNDFPLRTVDDYYMNVGNDRYKINNVYYRTDINETTYYRLLKSTTGVELVEITSKSYTDNVFIFQPINK